jgi:hypothetical protein
MIGFIIHEYLAICLKGHLNRIVQFCCISGHLSSRGHVSLFESNFRQVYFGSVESNDDRSLMTVESTVHSKVDRNL